MKRLLFILVLCSAACSSPRSSAVGQPRPARPEAETLPYRQCSADTDCVQVTDSCCDCSNGGQVLAVARDKEEAFKKTIVCGSGTCFESYGGCNEGTVECKAGLCAFRPGDPKKL